MKQLLCATSLALYAACAVDEELVPYCELPQTFSCHGAPSAGDPDDLRVAVASCDLPRVIYRTSMSRTSGSTSVGNEHLREIPDGDARHARCENGEIVCDNGTSPRCTLIVIPAENPESAQLGADCEPHDTADCDLSTHRRETVCPFELRETGWTLVVGDVRSECVAR